MEEEPEYDKNGESNHTIFSDIDAAAKAPFYASRFQVQSATPSPWVLASSKKTS